MKVALLGGSFDPVHYGHIQMAKTVKEQLGLDEVWFIPAYISPLKDRKLTSGKDRKAMLELALKKEPSFRVETFELERKKTSYTIDTLLELKRKYPEHTFYWILGNDQLQNFSKWKDSKKLVTLAQFVAIDRQRKLETNTYNMIELHMDDMPVSSSSIRKGNTLNYVPFEVLNYIYSKRLYIENFVKERVSKKRYKHSLSVAKLCEEIALAHQLDGQKAYLIGLFHDICKNLAPEKMEPWMDKLCPENKKYAVPVWHGFVGSIVLNEIFYIQDSQILNAIYHHVLGTSRDPYAMIVYCADKLDPLRGYPVQRQIEIVKEDLDKGFDLVKEENERYMQGKEA